MVSDEMRRICSTHSFNLIINNAGILSPPEYKETANGLEYTFQVNFLAHLLVNELVLNSINDDRNIKIATITSPVYRFASLGPGTEQGAGNYRPMRSYSSSKLYLAIMSDLLASRRKEPALHCFAFDPGTFSSEIYRMQKTWFRYLYHVAAPFMRSPGSVAKALEELMLKEKTVNGRIYGRSKELRPIPEIDKLQKSNFTDRCYALIDPFLK
jgi:NAD(P)-dependent dehydrogenase (short-subunit alcohol dehydrogenase family)